MEYPYDIYCYKLVGGFNPFEQYEFVSWDYDLPNMESHKIHVPVTTNQTLINN